MAETVDFSAFLDEPLSTDSDKLAQLTRLATEHKQLEADIAVVAATLAAKQKELASIAESKIPALMEALTLKRFDLEGGRSIVIDDAVFANISEAREPEANKWLDEHGHGSIIKTRVVRAFNRDQRDKALEYAQELNDKGIDAAIENKIEASTLKKFARERLTEEREAQEAGTAVPDFPRELFGVYTKKVAKFKNK